MDKNRLKDNAELLRTLAHPVRLKILQHLAAKPKCVTDIKELLDVSQPNLSQHLGLLRREGLVDYFENGKRRCYYQCRPKLVTALFQMLDTDFPIIIVSKDSVCKI